MPKHSLTLAILTLGMGAAVTASWFAFASRIQTFGLDLATVVSPSRLLVYGTQFLLIGAFVFWLAQGRLRHESALHVGLLVTAAWLGEGLVLTVIGEPIVANELDPSIAWYYWLVATGGPLQPAAAFVGGWLGLRHFDVRARR